jgi:hypothetical protein
MVSEHKDHSVISSLSLDSFHAPLLVFVVFMMDMPKKWSNGLMIAFQLYGRDESFLMTLCFTMKRQLYVSHTIKYLMPR